MLTLSKKVTGNKKTPYIYTVKDEAGKVVFSKTSKYDYVAFVILEGGKTIYTLRTVINMENLLNLWVSIGQKFEVAHLVN